ncbi:MAG TPA: hypothetical protein VFH51_19770 [Myxococcota bacterium]|nr:hypothetical protein [Myxococcota bacterium]
MPPENGGYAVTAYVLTAVILVGYAVILVRRARRAVERAARLEQ